MQIESQLLSELELAGSLNNAVSTARRADFSILLALMEQDVSQHAQFKLPRETRELVVQTEESLKRQLGVRAAYKLAADAQAYASANAQCQAVSNSDFVTSQLLTCLQQPALAQYNDEKRIDDEVLQNMHLYAQAKYQSKTTAKATEQTPDATQLLDILVDLNESSFSK
ncbi:VC2046/SO_2500 family protein [Gayadomonas joobiniege]|uniref:VC2046/SO_2500 family protein n=1 Tax=Gayadomonas joobiniege TaxID=1234606 RepID=UPI00037CC65E|nr:VC2046/SO_2500 family protein [Gayadomonas joobiniege]